MNALSATSITGPAPGTYQIDPSHTEVGFSARHLMVAKVRGRFAAFGGQVNVAATSEESSVEVTIQAASIDTRNDQRDEHLRSPDFLDVDRFPVITFRSTSVEQTGERTMRIAGDLTIKDVTRPVTLEADYEGANVDPFGRRVLAFSAKGEIDREEFGITWNQALETGGVLVGPKVRIEIDVEAATPAEQAA